MEEVKEKNTLCGDFFIYKDGNNNIKIEVYVIDETVWLTQSKMAELFDVRTNTINYHLKEIFKSKELDDGSVIRKIRITALDGKSYNNNFYNLDAIISVGYRVNSRKATMFRMWATKILKEYIIKGFAMDDERLKKPNYVFGKDYFEEQLNRISDIRTSERRFYQKITDIYSQCSADYDPNSELTYNFYKTVQNKLHYAITGKTAAEIVHERVDSKKPNLGLTNWKNAPKGKIRIDDVLIAKNYLNESEIQKLNRIVTMYLDYAEIQAENRVVMNMKDWISKLDSFLNFNQLDILKDSGKISHEIAEKLAIAEYKKYNTKEDKNYISDFDKIIKDYLEGGK